MGTNRDAKLAIRQKANEARVREKKAEARRRALLQGGIIVGVLVVVGAIVFAVVSINRVAQNVTRPEASATVQVGENSAVDFEVAGTAIRVGSADAPVTIALYEDFSCPHCRDYEAAVDVTLQELIAGDRVAVEYHPINIVTGYGTRAGNASTCVAVHAPDRWLPVHSALFAVHEQSTDGWTNEQFATFLDGQGIGGGEITECIESGRYAKWIGQNTRDARDAGVASTPTLFINGERQDALPGPDGLRTAVEALLP